MVHLIADSSNQASEILCRIERPPHHLNERISPVVCEIVRLVRSLALTQGPWLLDILARSKISQGSDLLSDRNVAEIWEAFGPLNKQLCDEFSLRYEDFPPHLLPISDRQRNKSSH
jgi:hypothetical protein